MLKVSTRITDIRQNTTIQPDGICGGWRAENTGTADAIVNGFSLPVGGVIDFTNIGIAPFVWNSAIVIEITSGAVVHLLQLQYTEV